MSETKPTTIAERRAQYEQSSLKQLMDATDHEVCERCFCCDAVYESYPCPLCGGFADEPDLNGDFSICDECGDEGKIFVKECLGRCDENGNHKETPHVR